MTRLIPEKLVNFMAWGGGGATAFLGMTDAELPAFSPMTEKVAGAGIAGEYDSPVIGHFGSQSVKLKFRTTTVEAMALLRPIQHDIDLRGSVQVTDSALGTLTTVAVRVNVRGQVKGLEPGKFEPGKPMDTSAEIEVAYLKIWIAGVEMVELDKFNMVFKVNGVDYLASVRGDTGL